MKNSTRSLLCIDMAYTFKTIKSTSRENFCKSRHFLGIFEKVYAIHPLADIANSECKTGCNFYRLSPKQLIIEGGAFVCGIPKFFRPIDFLLSQAKFLLDIKKIIHKRNISAIYATDPYYSGLFGLFLKILTGKKLVVLVAGNYDEIYEATGTLAYPKLFRFRFVENTVARIVLTFSDLVAGGNENNRRCAINHGAKPSKSTVFASAAILTDQLHRTSIEDRDYSLLSNLYKSESARNDISLLVIGRLLEVKLPKDALLAMTIILKKNPNTRGIFIGDGPLREEMTDFVNSNELSGKIIFTGNIDQSTLSVLIPNSIVLSPLTGLALIEAGLGGAAIVAYNRDWQPDFIEDGVNGYIVPFRNYEAMAEKALILIDNHTLRKQFSERIRKKSLDITYLPEIKNHFYSQWARIIELGNDPEKSMEKC